MLDWNCEFLCQKKAHAQRDIMNSNRQPELSECNHLG
jgi:hypothetical protein